MLQTNKLETDVWMSGMSGGNKYVWFNTHFLNGKYAACSLSREFYQLL